MNMESSFFHGLTGQVIAPYSKEYREARQEWHGLWWPSFGMTLEESKSEDDILDEEFGVSMVIDKKLSMYLEGAIVDYVESSNGGGFEIRTAKANKVGGCDSGCRSGCGGSC